MNLTSIARPYARAAFEIALAKKDLVAWEAFLQSAATIVADSNMQAFLKNPATTEKQIKEFFEDMLNGAMSEERGNLIKLLIENHRLLIIPALAEEFKMHLAEHNKQMTIEVSSAIAFTEEQKTALNAALTKRFAKQVSLNYRLDPAVMGGAVIKAGDVVIDGSVRGKLNRLIEFIS